MYRYEKAAAQEETAYQQQRRRLYAEVEEEKERLSVLAQQQRAELDQRAKEMVVSGQTTCHAVQAWDINLYTLQCICRII